MLSCVTYRMWTRRTRSVIRSCIHLATMTNCSTSECSRGRLPKASCPRWCFSSSRTVHSTTPSNLTDSTLLVTRHSDVLLPVPSSSPSLSGYMLLLEWISFNIHGSHAPGKSWKVLDFFGYNFQVLESPEKWGWSWKVLEIWVQGPEKSWNFLGYDNDVGGGQNDAGADAKIWVFAHLYRLFH